MRNKIELILIFALIIIVFLHFSKNENLIEKWIQSKEKIKQENIEKENKIESDIQRCLEYGIGYDIRDYPKKVFCIK